MKNKETTAIRQHATFFLENISVLLYNYVRNQGWTNVQFYWCVDLDPEKESSARSIEFARLNIWLLTWLTAVVQRNEIPVKLHSPPPPAMIQTLTGQQLVLWFDAPCYWNSRMLWHKRGFCALISHCLVIDLTHHICKLLSWFKKCKKSRQRVRLSIHRCSFVLYLELEASGVAVFLARGRIITVSTPNTGYEF
jgi:hypothetical protein